MSENNTNQFSGELERVITEGIRQGCRLYERTLDIQDKAAEASVDSMKEFMSPFNRGVEVLLPSIAQQASANAEMSRANAAVRNAEARKANAEAMLAEEEALSRRFEREKKEHAYRKEYQAEHTAKALTNDEDEHITEGNKTKRD